MEKSKTTAAALAFLLLSRSAMPDYDHDDGSTQYLTFLNTRPVVELVGARKQGLSIRVRPFLLSASSDSS